jgi:exonuclease III
MLNSNTKSIPELCSRELSIAFLNINSLIAHIDQQLRICIHSLRSNIDVLAINESKLDASITNNEISIPGYDVVRRDRQHHGRNDGGVCLYCTK